MTSPVGRRGGVRRGRRGERRRSVERRKPEVREITFADRATMRKARRGLFGFSLPNLGGLFGGDDDSDKEDRVTAIDTTIQSVSMDKSGKYRLTVEGGAVWVQIDTTRLPRQPKPGQKVKIKVATMGSYFATIDGGRTIRMKRDR